MHVFKRSGAATVSGSKPLINARSWHANYDCTVKNVPMHICSQDSLLFFYVLICFKNVRWCKHQVIKVFKQTVLFIVNCIDFDLATPKP